MIEVETTMRFRYEYTSMDCIRSYIKQLSQKLPINSSGITFTKIVRTIYYPEFAEITIRGTAPAELCKFFSSLGAYELMEDK